jgi:hypothetical protein
MALLLFYDIIAGAECIANGTDRTENTVPNDSSIVACVYFTAGTCVPSRSLAAAVSSRSELLDFNLYVTILT